MSKSRILNSIKADIKFQIKHGFYTVYIVLSVIYVIVLSFIPAEPTKYILPLFIFFDPAGLGLFFIGGMILLEREQGVLALLYITPLKVSEYIFSKIVTLGAISALSGIAISLASYGLSANYLLLLVGVFLVSVFYTLFGFLIASNCKSVNDYMFKMVPAIMLSLLPCISLIPYSIIPKFINTLLLFIPSVGGLKLLFGSFSEISFLEIIICVFALMSANFLLLKKVSNVLKNKVILNS